MGITQTAATFDGSGFSPSHVRIWSAFIWKISGAHLILNRSINHLYLTSGVLNVVSREQASSSLIWRNTLFVSSLWRAPWPQVFCWWLPLWWSCLMTLFKSLGPIQMWTLSPWIRPLVFCTVTAGWLIWICNTSVSESASEKVSTFRTQRQWLHTASYSVSMWTPRCDIFLDSSHAEGLCHPWGSVCITTIT